MMSQLLAWILPAVIYGGLALCVASAGVVHYRLVARVAPEWRIAAALFTVGMGALLVVAMTSRNLDESALGPGRIALYEDYAGGFAASRLFTVLLIGASIVEVVRGVVQARGRLSVDPAWPVMAAMLAFYGGTLVVQMMMSEHPGFSLKALYVPIFFLAVYYQRVTSLDPVLFAAKITILILNLGSLVLITIRPDEVLFRPYVGMIPGIDWRLFGLTPHANTLGPIALLGLILELHTPSRSTWMRWLGFGASAAVLLLAQSRTAWIAGVVVAAVVCLPLELALHAEIAGQQRAFGRAVGTVLVCVGALIAIVFIVNIAAGSGYLQSKADLGTLDGRFAIWDITLEAWRENVLFGYGPDVWGPDRQLRFRLFHVGQAHNQVMQTLGEAGLVGLLLLTLYLGTLAFAACQRLRSSRGLSLALLVLLLTRCVTEAPMRTEGVLSWPTFLHVLLLVVVCRHLRLTPTPASESVKVCAASRPAVLRSVRAMSRRAPGTV